LIAILALALAACGGSAKQATTPVQPVNTATESSEEKGGDAWAHEDAVEDAVESESEDAADGDDDSYEGDDESDQYDEGDEDEDLGEYEEGDD
jgi:hypothetical protein